MENTINNAVFFEAALTKLRFDGSGSVQVEDLFDLSLADLDKRARAIALAAQGDGITFLKNTSRRQTKADKENALRLEVYKAIIQYKEEKAAKAAERTARQAQLTLLKELRAKREFEELSAQSVADLDAQIAALSEDSDD